MLGILLGIGCAIAWSVSIILFKKAGDTTHPVLMNLCKNVIAAILFIPTVFLIEGPLPESLTRHDVILLLVSGFIGIGLADGMVLKALKNIGASRMGILECLYSPFVIVLSMLFLGEALTGYKILGAILVMAAIVCVSIRPEILETHNRRAVLVGMRWGALGLFSMAGGIVLVKPIFATVPLFWVIEIRVLAGVAGSLIVFLLFKDRRGMLRSLKHVEHKWLLAAAFVLSTYISMMLWVSGYKYNDATVAAVLNQTSTIFTVVLAAVVLKERLTKLKILGTILALGGVLLISLG